MRFALFVSLLIAGLLAAVPADAVDIDRFLRKDTFEKLTISPTGDYFAATVPFEDRTALVILRRSDRKLLGTFSLGRHSHVQEFVWVSPERLLIAVAEKMGSLDRPVLTGELFAMDADGSSPELLVGYRAQDNGLGTRIVGKKEEFVYAELVDDLPADDRNVIIAVTPFSADAYSRADRMDVHTGRRVTVARSPVRNASFVTDNKGVVRFTYGIGTDRRMRVFHRAAEGQEWELISDETRTGLAEIPVGFAEDDRTAYLVAEQADGPDKLIAYDVVTRERRPVLGHEIADPARLLYRPYTRTPIGAVFLDGRRHTSFIDRNSPEARMQRSLEAAFAGHAVEMTSRTRDGRLTLVEVFSDRNPGDFYLFDSQTKKADLVISRREWIDIDAMAEQRPVTIAARDGTTLHGYLTVPRGREGRLPMIVHPHGGPFGVQDVWGFDDDVQMLAAAGYAVLQVNFRGSSGYGKAFRAAGAREWGGRMQDDLTDATRWAIAQGHADPARICIYGASYGGYAALMGVAKEPDLYACAAGYVGVYDLPTMYSHGDIQRSTSGETYLREWLGAPEAVAAVSPARLAGRIRAPVFLAAGGEDERAPPQHTEMMEKALRRANVPVEALYYATEGHGFYREEHRREYYARLLAFFARHLGGQAATTGAAPADAKK